MTQAGKVWTVQEALDWTRGYLERKEDANPLLSARFLVSHATGLSHLELYTMFDRPLSLDERDVLRDAVSRRGHGEPLQYISGHAPFRHLDIKTRPNVLIPRPETEVLVDEVLSFLGGMSASRVIEVGCGSGCIACSLATEMPACDVWATDISPDACSLARENASDAGLDGIVHIIECDLDSGIPDELRGTFDVLVSNPPYIPDAVMEVLPDEVRGYEPHLALAGGADGLDVFRRLLARADGLVREGGMLAIELHEGSLDDACRLAEDAGMADVRMVRDLAGRPRILTCSRKVRP